MGDGDGKELPIEGVNPAKVVIRQQDDLVRAPYQIEVSPKFLASEISMICLVRFDNVLTMCG